MKSIKPKRITATYVSTLELAWYARRLSILGEPAGYDFMQRRTFLTKRLVAFISAYKGLPGVSRQLAREKPLVNMRTKNLKLLKSVLALVKKEDWLNADERMQIVVRDVFSTSIWYAAKPKGPIDASPYTHPFGAPRKQLREAVQEYRTTLADESISETRQQIQPDFDSLLGELNSAATSLSSSGMVGDLTGPQWLSNFAGLWQSAQVQAIQSVGLAEAHTLSNPQDASAGLDSLLAAQQQFSDSVVAGISSLINADATRVSSSEARSLYVEYLSVLAPIISLSDDPALMESLQSPLDALASKAPDFHGDVSSYRTFTSDLLRWRERVAASYVAGKGSDTSLAAAFSGFAVASEVESERLIHPLLGSSEQYAFLNGPAPVAVSAVGSKLDGQQIKVADLIANRNGSGQWTSRKHGPVYGVCSFAIDFTPAIDDLRSALLISDESPALTLEAALAIESARQGDLAEAGGSVSDLVLEGRVSRHATMSEDDWGLIRLGQLADEEYATGSKSIYILQNVLAKVVFEPRWLRHRYFFFEL